MFHHPRFVATVGLDPGLDRTGCAGRIAPDQAQRRISCGACLRRYDSGPEISWLLLIKPSLSPSLTEDITNYSVVNKNFPQDPTSEQFFDDIQWESYRALGQQIGRRVML